VKTKVISVPIDLLRPVVCVRRDVGDLTALVDSIREYGLLQPLLVSESDDGTFGIIWGYRRYLAALEAGLRELPVISLGKVSLEKALELILKEDVLRLRLKRDERCLTLAALAMSWGVRKTARILKIPPSTVESAKKAGITLKGVWSIVRSSHPQKGIRKLKVKIKLAEEIYKALSRAGYKAGDFEETAGRLYLMLMDFPTKVGLELLERWVGNPTLDYMKKLISEQRKGEIEKEGTLIRPVDIKERVPITLNEGTPLEEVLSSYSWYAGWRYRVVEETTFKIVEFEGEHSDIAAIVCPRCSLPLRCRVCGSQVGCLCGFPHKSVRHTRYRYAVRAGDTG